MKKIYQIPTTTVMNVEPQVMMAGSDFERRLGTTGGSGSTALGRRDTFWDEGEEE